MTSQLNRRAFLRSSAVVASAAAAAPWLASSARAASPNGKLRTAHIGVGGMGGADLKSISSHPQVEVFALCDVDSERLAKALELHPKAKTYRDYRELLAALGDKIDAVAVSTPDHTHAPAALAALTAGKPVYCQKPLTHEVAEARKLRQVADERGLVTQMGIQVHSSEIYRRAVQMIQAGVIGKVSRVHAWSSKNWGFDGAALPAAAEAPQTLDWNLWLGTAADRKYVPGVYHPGQWRKLIDFGTGTLGDMGVHIFDTPYAALELTAPKWARTTCRTPTGLGHPEQNVVEYEFPGTKHTTSTLSWKWYDGGFAPPKIADLDLPASLKLPPDFELPGQGSLFIGEGGAMLLPHVAEAVLFPEVKFRDYVRPRLEPRNHYHEWVDACRGEGKTSAGFAYAGPLTEALLLGVVANRFPDEQLEWDAGQLKVTNVAAANKLLTSEYRKF
ncbi:MAG: Gfo/Idh/MocA family oxidoreductase [Planctomycetaceae bacterium]|nr:Gfo/Idh/MocA family oxidoreductase [Planctomycetaceae bacterium]